MHEYLDSYVDSFPYQVNVDLTDPKWFFCNECKDWLIENIGELYDKWQMDRDQYSKYYFRFKNEEDKVKFILRWL